MFAASQLPPHQLFAACPAQEFATLERQAPQRIAETQARLLSEHLRYAAEHSPFYRARFREHGIDPEFIRSIADLARIPCTGKSDLSAHNPEFLAAPENEIADVCLTSASTSGAPCALLQTAADLARLAYNEEAAFGMLGIGPGDTMLMCAAIDRCFMAGLAYFMGGVKRGARLVRAGSGSAAQQWQMLKTCGANVMVGVPSLMRHIGEYARENGEDPARAGIRTLVAIGEPTRGRGLDLLPAARQAEETWGAKIFSTYASTEIATSFCECRERCGGHLRPELIVVEIVDDTGASLSVGQEGEIVVTPLGVRGMPLVRFRTGDVSFLIEEPCACGRRTPRLAPILGRKNQMLKFKGTTVFPNAVVAAVEGLPEVGGAYIEAHRNPDGTDRIVVYVHVRGLELGRGEGQKGRKGQKGQGGKKEQEERKRLEEEVRARVRVVPEIRLVTGEELNARVYETGKRKRTTFFDLRT
jgi:phenylacetate-CoA ligase